MMVRLWKTERNCSKFWERRIYEQIARIINFLQVSKLDFKGLADARSVTVDNSNMILSTCKEYGYIGFPSNEA